MLLSIILVDLFFLSRSNVKYSTHELLGTGGFAKEGVAFLILNPRAVSGAYFSDRYDLSG